MANLAVVPEETPNISALIEEFLTSCRARGLSPATLRRGYEPPLLRLFLPWCDARGITNTSQLDQRVIDQFTLDLHQNGGPNRSHLAMRSVHSYVRTVSQFLKWCRKQGEPVDGSPQLPRLSRIVLNVLSRKEIEDMEDAAPTERDKLIIRLLADTGMRSNELRTLTPQSLVTHNRRDFLHVHGKGSHERLVPISPLLVKRIQRYLKHRPTDTVSPYIFLGLRREAHSDYQTPTTSGIRTLVQAAADRAGIKKRVYPHLLRHSFATEALRRGMNSMQLAKILGHTSLRMIERTYSHLDQDDAYDAVVKMLARS